jgi:hypothetical protein
MKIAHSVAIGIAALLWPLASSALSAEVTVIPAAPRYMEPVFLRIKQTPYPTFSVQGASVAMNGNNLDVRLSGVHDLGSPSDDVMLGRLPAGSYTVSIHGGAAVASFTVASPEQSQPALLWVPMVNYTDLWWNPAQPGWGVSIHQGATNEVFATWYDYDSDGKPVWYTLQPGRWISLTTYTGPIYRTSGPPFGASFDPSRVGITLVGKGSLSFTNATSGTFIYTIDQISGQRSIQRQPIE